MSIPRPLYTRIKRISLYERHAALKPFFVELEALPNDIANEALLRAVSLGSQQALQEAHAQIERRRQGLPAASDVQPVLFDLHPSRE